jgi:hypothetical protein
MTLALRLAATVVAAIVLTGCGMPPLTDAASLMSLPAGEDRAIPDPTVPGGVILDVPLTRLLCQPERYHGKRVQVSGAISLAFERNVICVVPGASECLWLSGVTEVPDPGFRSARGLVEGTFDGELRGHFGGTFGSIVSITRIAKR